MWLCLAIICSMLLFLRSLVYSWPRETSQRCDRTAFDCSCWCISLQEILVGTQMLCSETSRFILYYQFIIKDTFQEKPNGREGWYKVWGWKSFHTLLGAPLPPSTSMCSPTWKLHCWVSWYLLGFVNYMQWCDIWKAGKTRRHFIYLTCFVSVDNRLYWCEFFSAPFLKLFCRVFVSIF